MKRDTAADRRRRLALPHRRGSRIPQVVLIAAAISDLTFPEGTGFLEVAAGEYKLDIAPSGSAWDAAVLTVEGLELEKDGSYTAVAFNVLKSVQPLALADDLSAPPAGSIRVRAIHTAAGVGTVDTWEVSDPGNPTPLYTDFGFGDAGAYLELPAAAYQLGFDVDDDAVPDLVFALPPLNAGTIANVFAVADDAVFLLAQFADGSTARIDPRVTQLGIFKHSGGGPPAFDRHRDTTASQF
ncbi:MAG: DUF4397 domain-containing protein [Candidatus Eisenbacteria bacterium]|nr:DUF4397 domain-containing protein [Candidatus Eisenbacteria bacterium]